MEQKQETVPTHVQMLHMINTLWLTSCIRIAAQQGFADIIYSSEQQQAAVDEIAAQSAVHPVWTYAILRALALAHIFQETTPGSFTNTPLSDVLRANHPQSMKWHATVVLSPRSLI